MKVVDWIEELSSKHIGWSVFGAMVVILPALLTFLGRRSWERRLHRWADEQGLALVSFCRARASQRMRLVSAFGEWNSDWLEVFEVVVDTKERQRRTGLVAFKSWLGLGPYRYRDVRWIG
jgi:hypothetical protein